jgi:hypothetical protein
MKTIYKVEKLAFVIQASLKCLVPSKALCMVPYFDGSRKGSIKAAWYVPKYASVRYRSMRRCVLKDFNKGKRNPESFN